MGFKNFFLLKTHFDLFLKRIVTVDQFLNRDMLRIIRCLLAFLCNYVLYFFVLIIGYVFRLQEDGRKRGRDLNLVYSKEDDEFDLKHLLDAESNGFREGAVSDSQSCGIFNNGEKVTGDCSFHSVSLMNSSAFNTSKYQFTSGRELCGLMEEPKMMSCSVEEFNVENDYSSVDSNPIYDTEASVEKDFQEEEIFDNHESSEHRSTSVIQTINQVLDTEPSSVKDSKGFNEIDYEAEIANNKDKTEQSVFDFNDGKVLDKPQDQDSLPEVQAVWEDYSTQSDSESESICSNDSSSKTNDNSDRNTEACSHDPTIISDQFWGSDDEYIEIDPYKMKDSGHKMIENFESSEKSKEPMLNYDEEDEFEFSEDHDDVMEQLKMELRNVRTGGLSTILEEEAEFSEMGQVLKPLKIDEKCEYKDRIAEIQKVYKNYAEKMRKLDILNSQTLHAIGLLQLKDPTLGQKSSLLDVKPLLSQSLWSRKARRITASDPTLKSTRDLQKDLEQVYVGQLCLSWEILKWQHRKSHELQEYDSQSLRQYNQVADDFQLFQVLLHRFNEDEKFQRPGRVPTYVNKRCVVRAFLQVPAVKDDCFRDKKLRKGDGEYAISSAMLTEIIMESMRVFWEFLRADKDEESHASLKPTQQNQICLHDPADSHLLMDIRADLHKKERKLKDITRSSHCIVKKLQKHHQDEGRLSYALFIAAVELKLISRVLRMSKFTPDQLLWCHQKLHQFNFVNRRVHLEPSLLLFPC